MASSEEEESDNDSEPEMFDNVLEKSDGPKVIDAADLTQSDEEEDTPIKAPPPKRKLGPKPGPATTKRKIESSDSEASPVKRKVIKIKMIVIIKYFNFIVLARSKEKDED